MMDYRARCDPAFCSQLNQLLRHYGIIGDILQQF